MDPLNKRIHFKFMLLKKKAIWRIVMLALTFEIHPWVRQLLFKQRVHQLPQVFEDHTNPYRSLKEQTTLN